MFTLIITAGYVSQTPTAIFFKSIIKGKVRTKEGFVLIIIIIIITLSVVRVYSTV